MRQKLDRFSPAVWALGTIVLSGLAAVLVVKLGASGGNIVLGGLAALGVVLALVQNPKWAPVLVIAAAVYDRRIYYNYETLQLSTLIVVLAVTAPAFFIAAAKSRTVPGYFTTGAVLLALGLIVANLVAPHADFAWIGTLHWVLVLNAVIGTVAMSLDDESLPRRLMWWVLAGGAFAGVLGIAQRAGKYFLVGPPYAQDVYNSTFGYYSNFANFEAMATVLGIGLFLLLRKENRRGSFVALALTSVCGYSVAASLSRGALICAAVGLAVMVFKQFKSPTKFVGSLAAVGALGALVWSILPTEYTDEFVARFVTQPRGDIVRQQMQAGGFDLLKQNPLGIGFNNFSSFVSAGLIDASQALSHAHNTYIQMGLDGGWVGLLGFLILTMGAVFGAYRGEAGTARFAAGAALVGFLAQITQDYFFFEPASLALFGILLALSAAGPRRAHESPAVHAASPRSRPLRHVGGRA